MNTKYLRGKVEVKAEGDRVTVVASDESLDRHGDILPIQSWDLSKFMGSPRMLVDHDHRVSSIVGRWKNARVVNNQLLMDADFHDITDLSKAVHQMVNEGYLDTVSVGFIYHEAEGEKDAVPTFELIETSWVTVPANPNARTLKSLMEKEVTAEQKALLEKFEEEPEDDDTIDPQDDDEVDDAEDEGAGDADTEIDPSEQLQMVDSLAQYKEMREDPKLKSAAGLSVTFRFLDELIELSEQRKTLTSEVDAKKNARLVQMALKEAAGIISDSLRTLNQAGVN